MSSEMGDKVEEINKEEWMESLHESHVTRADMNCLIMNYLVTGAFGALLCLLIVLLRQPTEFTVL